MSEALQLSKQKLAEDLRQSITDAEEVLRLTADQVGESAAQLRSRLTERMLRAKDELAHLQHISIAKVKEAGHAADEYVHANPWKSVGIAAGLGLVVGMLISRR